MKKLLQLSALCAVIITAPACAMHQGQNPSGGKQQDPVTTAKFALHMPKSLKDFGAKIRDSKFGTFVGDHKIAGIATISGTALTGLALYLNHRYNLGAGYALRGMLGTASSALNSSLMTKRNALIGSTLMGGSAAVAGIGFGGYTLYKKDQAVKASKAYTEAQDKVTDIKKHLIDVQKDLKKQRLITSIMSRKFAASEYNDIETAVDKLIDAQDTVADAQQGLKAARKELRDAYWTEWKNPTEKE